MELRAQNYVSPLASQGNFTDIKIIDSRLTHRRDDKYLEIEFEMSYVKNDIKQVLAKKSMGFQGMENDEVSTNRTTTMSIPNPDYDAGIEGSQQRMIVPLFDYLTANANVMPLDYTIVDYGYPTYEKVMMYFTGGTLDAPEIFITDPLAIGFLLNNLIINGEVVKTQFTMV